jgi:predicted secreted hydrolase
MPDDFKPIKFPADESAHDYIVEWWYFNGHLQDADGNGYAFMDCLFKVDVEKVKIPFLSRIPLKTTYFSHSQLSDIKQRSFNDRIAPFSVISDDSFSKEQLYINYINPEIKNGYHNCIIEKVGASKYHIKNEDIDLTMTPMKECLLEGGDGYVNLHSRSAYYYSLTNLKTEGRIKVADKWLDVTGKSWMDHQWANASYSKDRWDWFSIQLDDDTEIVCFVYDDGKDKTYLADISYPDGHREHHAAVEIIPSEKHWVSPKSKASYPLAWQIKIPAKAIELNLTAKIENQEMLFGSINYFEGPVSVEGSFGGTAVRGDGFMELVGYPSEYSNIKYITDEVSDMVSRFIEMGKKKAFDFMSSFNK